MNESSEPCSIGLAEFQQLIRKMYHDKDAARGVDGTFMWLIEEVGELAAALREGSAEDKMEEFADVLAWLTTIANLADIDLTEAVRRKYGTGCPGCGHLVCACPRRRKTVVLVFDSNRITTRRPTLGTQVLGAARLRTMVPSSMIIKAIILGFALTTISYGEESTSTNKRPPSALPDQQRPTITSVSVGLGGRHKIGCWTAMAITIAPGTMPWTGRCVVEVTDGEELAAIYAEDHPITVTVDRPVDVVRHVRFGRQRAPVRVQLVDASNVTIAQWETPPDELSRGVLTSQPMVGIVGSDVGVREFARQSDRRVIEQIATCQLDPSKQQLPESWLGYDGLDVMFVAASAPAAHQLNALQVEAIVEWVAQGGRLVWFGARGITECLAEHEAWQRLLPGTPTDLDTSSRLPGLERFLSAREPLATSPGGVEMLRLANPRGVARAYEGLGRNETAIWIHAPSGLGQVIFVGVDLAEPPFTDWDATPRAVELIMEHLLGAERGADATGHSGRASHLGYRDLSGQLRSGLDYFEAVNTFPVVLVGLLALGYIALVGPLDYLLVGRLVDRPWLTWVTFPLIVIGTCGLIYQLARAWKGTDWLGNTACVVDIDTTTGLERGTAWLQLFSPENGVISLASNFVSRQDGGPTDVVRDNLTSWSGLAGDGFGGMNRPSRGINGGDSYWHTMTTSSNPTGRTSRLSHYPMRANSSRSFLTRWLRQPPQEPPVAPSLPSRRRRRSLEWRDLQRYRLYTARRLAVP